MKQYKLPQSLQSAGYIAYTNLVFAFGGIEGDKLSNRCYVLNLSGNSGWSEIEGIQCPLSNVYVACLAADNAVHIFGVGHEGHYSIPIRALLYTVTTVHGAEEEPSAACNEEMDMMAEKLASLKVLCAFCPCPTDII